MDLFKVGQWMSPKVKGKKSAQLSIVFILHKALGIINNVKWSDQPSDSNVRELVAKVNGCREEFKSTFVGQLTKVSCLKIPQHIFSKELLKQIDKRTCFVWKLAIPQLMRWLVTSVKKCAN